MEKPCLLYLLLCDTVAPDAEGKKNLIGTFDRVLSKEMPCVFRRFSIVTGWEGLDGDYLMKVEIQAPNGGKTIFTSPPLGLRFGHPLYRADVILEVEGLKFETPGVYKVCVFLGGKPKLTYPLLVEKVS